MHFEKQVLRKLYLHFGQYQVPDTKPRNAHRQHIEPILPKRFTTMTRIIATCFLLCFLAENSLAQLDSLFHGVIVLESDNHSGRHDGRRPEFCDGKDCPDFKVKSNETGYQVREYDSGTSTRFLGIRGLRASVILDRAKRDSYGNFVLNFNLVVDLPLHMYLLYQPARTT